MFTKKLTNLFRPLTTNLLSRFAVEAPKTKSKTTTTQPPKT